MPPGDFEACLGCLKTCLEKMVKSGCGGAYLNFTTTWEEFKANQNLKVASVTRGFSKTLMHARTYIRLTAAVKAAFAGVNPELSE